MVQGREPVGLRLDTSDGESLRRFCRSLLAQAYPTTFFVELIQSFGRMSHHGALKLGTYYGRACQAPLDHGFEVVLVPPKRWQKEVPGLPAWERWAKSRAWKNANARGDARKVKIQAAAMKLEPKLPLTTKNRQGIADAFFIALWGARSRFGYTYPT